MSTGCIFRHTVTCIYVIMFLSNPWRATASDVIGAAASAAVTMNQRQAVSREH